MVVHLSRPCRSAPDPPHFSPVTPELLVICPCAYTRLLPPLGVLYVLLLPPPVHHALGSLQASWFISPIFAGIVASVVFFITRAVVLRHSNAFYRSFYVFPVFVMCIISINGEGQSVHRCTVVASPEKACWVSQSYWSVFYLRCGCVIHRVCTCTLVTIHFFTRDIISDACTANVHR